MRSLKMFGAAVCILVATVAALPSQPRASKQSKVTTFADVFSGTFRSEEMNFQWISQGKDGSYTHYNDDGDIIIGNIVDGNTSILVANSKVAPAAKDWFDYVAQPNGEHVLFAVNGTQQYRTGFFADYYIFSVADQTTVPLFKDQVGDIQWADWSPSGNIIAYVRDNNLYVWDSGATTQITNDGGPDVFNAVPDWVYEEEILLTYFAAWFSPNGKKLAYLRFDDAGVPVYQIPLYTDGSTAPAYPRYLEYHYPKVGETNPTVTLHLVDLENLAAGPTEVKIDSFASDNLIIKEVVWVTDTASHVMVRTFNRAQNQEKLVLIDTATAAASVVRERTADDGWIDVSRALSYVPGTKTYLDVTDESGWKHIYSYSIDGSTPTAITKGNWEVDELLNINTNTSTVYYTSTERHSTERHLYSISLDGTNKQALVDDTKPGVFTADFSTGGGYYVLSYEGPDLPHQELYSTNSKDAIRTITDNADLAAIMEEYALPKVSWFEIEHPDGYSLNVKERLPALFDPSKKYPVLFNIYGAPAFQNTVKTFKQGDFNSYLASDPELEYIILTVDNRGTGGKGRDFTNLVYKQLGKLEAADQVFAAQEYGKRDYVDKSHIAILGASYGGYVAAKVVETNSDVFSFAIMVAPVTDWRFYDTIYTERYMNLLSSNEAGYKKSAVEDTTGFQNIRGGSLILHGTADDNVHFQNSAVLVRTLTAARVSPKKFHVQWFTDSTHNLDNPGTTTLLYKKIARFLWLEKNRVDEPEHQFDKRWNLGIDEDFQ